MDGNLILINYSSTAIASFSVSHNGEAVASAGEGIVDTQLCAFTLPEEAGYAYTVSFETADGETVTGEFTDGNTVCLRADRAEDGWRLVYDE